MLTVSIGVDMVLRKGMTRFWIKGLTVIFSQEYQDTTSSWFLLKYQNS